MAGTKVVDGVVISPRRAALIKAYRARRRLWWDPMAQELNAILGQTAHGRLWTVAERASFSEWRNNFMRRRDHGSS